MPRQSEVRYVTQRLSLRKPQAESLELLDRLCDALSLAKSADVGAELAALKTAIPTFGDFERDFPSLCFALATGVGKTRLMGAFISYLYKARGIRHFFVLAPNLTIYDKLIADFTRGTPKYVFQGIDAFAVNAPRLITGDNYEEVRGLAAQDGDQPVLFDSGEAHINVFNISKINSEVRGGKEPKFKRMREVLGGSYFDYLAGLPDLVLLMDESHRYRAEAGMRAINELKPILGLELTATPQTERSGPFRNVVYSYPLSEALKDGLVKEPAVATRENFKKEAYDEASLERLKLEDGLKIHEVTQSRLKAYAANSGQRLVRPFVLIVAQDTRHAEQIKLLLESADFMEGKYRGKTMTVHSNQKGAESDEAVQKLLALESPGNPIEVVIHVNKLGEGWDVTNLYTLIPLRAANARNLVEQSIGRGLRLPYGKRTGVKDVDRLTVVAHDRFQEILDEANRPDSLIRGGVVIGRDIPEKPDVLIQARPVLDFLAGSAGPDPYSQESFESLFKAGGEVLVAEATLAVLEGYVRVPVQDLAAPERLAEIIRKVEAATLPAQAELEGVGPTVDVGATVAKAVQAYVDHQIAIPKVMVFPKDRNGSLFAAFDLDVSVFDRETFPPVGHDILIQHLRTNDREQLDASGLFHAEPRPENYLVRKLWDKNDVNRSDPQELAFLYTLATRAVEVFKKRGLLGADLDNVLAYYGSRIADLIYTQMLEHPAPGSSEFEVSVTQAHSLLKPSTFSLAAGSRPLPFRRPVDHKKDIRGMVFTGFKKCLRDREQFQSDPERRFAAILEDSPEVLRWSKLAKDQIYIRLPDDSSYLPDFVVDTLKGKWLVEVKAANEIADADVQLKAKAAVLWCQRAAEYETATHGKTWSYALIPDTAITAQAGFGALMGAYRRGVELGTC